MYLMKESAKRLSQLQSLDHFHSFMETHNKEYKDKAEYKKRYCKAGDELYDKYVARYIDRCMD